jgi:large subunit ribosomal protein L13
VNQKTYVTKEADIQREWWIVDAKGQNLGRLATRIAHILRGKHKPLFVPNMDVGDYVIVINCEQITVTGNKLDEKRYYRYSGYPGGMSSVTLRQQLDRFPDRALTLAVRGMMPKGPLGRQMLKKLKVYAGSEHPHAGQQPKVLELKEGR